MTYNLYLQSRASLPLSSDQDVCSTNFYYIIIFFGLFFEKEEARLLLHTALHALIRGLVTGRQFDPEGTGFIQNIYSMGNAQCRNA